MNDKCGFNNMTILLILIILAIIVCFIYLIYTYNYSVNLRENFRRTSKAFVGVWSSDINCPSGMKYVSLASALPDSWPNINSFFSGYISGTYSPTLSSGYSQYLISIGGSNATTKGWNNFLNNPQDTANKLYSNMVPRGLVGVEFDLEGTLPEQQTGIIQLVSALKKLNSNIIIQYTILIGSPSTFDQLITDNQMDYVALMLYNGGMYSASGQGAGCNWDAWAEIFLSKCQTCNCQPLGLTCAAYCGEIGTYNNLTNKVILGLIVDTTGTRIDVPGIQRAMDLCYKYNGAGVYFWVLPGWANSTSQTYLCSNMLTAMRSYNPNVNNYFEIGTCVTTCTASWNNGGGENPVCEETNCNSCTSECVATECGITQQNVTNQQCAPCLEGKQSWWPCKPDGLCQCLQ